ncbi:copper resistance CopC family protein [Halalkalibacter flavus]|uniref:copper resistance CopC family protein n=1 Tax=Halalkalibacter flavus TaxID=3090668 RepID=UPI002FC86BEF
MKKMKWLFVMCMALLLFPLHVAAHSYVTESTPGDGEVIEEAVEQIVLHFNAGIERVSTATVYNEDGEEIEVENIDVESPDLTIFLVEPLLPGEYVVEWRALGEDTHQTKGSISFEVLEYEIEEEAMEESTETEIDEVAIDEEETTTDVVDEPNVAENDEVVVESSMERFLLPIVITGAIAVLVSLLLLIKRLRK